MWIKVSYAWLVKLSGIWAVYVQKFVRAVAYIIPGSLSLTVFCFANALIFPSSVFKYYACQRRQIS